MFPALRALLVAFLLSAHAAAAGDADVLALLTRQADAWDKAIVRKDGAAVAANMASDFRQIRSNGSVANRTQFLEAILSPALTIDPYTIEGFDVRVYGDTALLSGTTRMTGREDGEEFATHYRYIDIYVRRDGQWQIVSVQITRISE